jgi:hypothetical protein
MSALDVNLAAFPPTAALLPKSSPNPQVLESLPFESSPFESSPSTCHGGGLRGLFWALMLEGGVIILATGVIMAWRVLLH